MATFATDSSAAEEGSSQGVDSSATAEFQTNETSDIDPETFWRGCDFPENYLHHPLGTPRIAAIQWESNNTKIIRRFEPVDWKLVRYYGSRVAALDEEVRQYEKANSDKLRRLTKYQLRLPNRPEVMSHYDVLIAELFEARAEYHKVVSQYREMQQLHSVPRPQAKNFMLDLMGQGMFENEDAYGYMKAPDDFGTVVKPFHPWITRLLYSSFHAWLMSRFSVQEGGSRLGLLSEDVVITVLGISESLLAIMLLAVPIGVMLLCGLTRAGYFGLIVGSTVMFALVALAAAKKVDHHYIYGYMAVLVALAAQLA
ncbi:hypothetical protein B0T26DRAFT_748587 [Lasiosphaeria miniovina]|uniref:DUF6594 domain-containing protein n=1 Tax=Lasiosphaeria miniovina TaxID=1954250 RepID=A0AA40B6B9_9PEZI|nr:uncharacterized protein B0T26DRAFT_748587 [Lasiosphaeria miniovina]KAK0728357.1 hypothetical protein B0T26DRAFT_748587 [Lasiosphaeria miniovina]